MDHVHALLDNTAQTREAVRVWRAPRLERQHWEALVWGHVTATHKTPDFLSSCTNRAQRCMSQGTLVLQ